MTEVTFSDFQANLAKLCDTVEDDQSELVVTREDKEPVVVVSAKEWSSIQETLYLLSTPANAANIRKSIAQADRGELVYRDPIDS